MQVVLPVRNQEKAETAVIRIKEDNGHLQGTGSLTLMHMDSSSLKSVRNFAQQFKKSFSKLNILINNAGAVMQLSAAGLIKCAMCVLTWHAGRACMCILMCAALQTHALARMVHLLCHAVVVYAPCLLMKRLMQPAGLST